MALHRQLTTSKQLLEALSERACLWQHHPDAAEETAQPPATADVTVAAASHQHQQQEEDRATDSFSFSPGSRGIPAAASSAAPGSSDGHAGAAGDSTSIKQHQLLLLQQALFPLTRSQHKGEGGVLRDDDLRPHAAPKAQQVYDTLVRLLSLLF